MKKEIFKPDIYKNIGLDQLVVFSAARIIESNEECTFERLVYECFTLFPEVFGLLRYPDWPDSARINKSWLRCRTDKGWLAGSTKEGFRLTKKGEQIAKETQDNLKVKKRKSKPKKSTQARERYEAIIRYITNSVIYKKYLDENADSISESEFITFLGGTLETPKRILRHNLNIYFDAVRVYSKKEILPFLEHCKKRLIRIRD
jgi:hypothetical protein